MPAPRGECSRHAIRDRPSRAPFQARRAGALSGVILRQRARCATALTQASRPRRLACPRAALAAACVQTGSGRNGRGAAWGASPGAAHQAVPRGPLREPLPAKFRAPAEPADDRRKALLEGAPQALLRAEVIDHDDLAPGLVTRAISSSARSGSGTVVMISAEGDARDFVGFSARGVSPVALGATS